MKVICTPSGIVDRDRPGQGILDIKEAGFGGMLLDMTMYCLPSDLESTCKPPDKSEKQKIISSPENPSELTGKQHGKSEEKKSLLPADNPSELGRYSEALLDKCQKAGLNTSVALAPYFARNTVCRDTAVLSEKLACESIRLCGRAGCRYLIVRPLHAGIARENEWSVNREYYLRLAEAARDKNVVILLQNQCRSVNGHYIRGICSDAAEAASWVDRLNEAAGEERFGFCMDVGAYHLCGQGMREAAVILGKRVKAVILRDCDVLKENSMLPFTGVGQGRSKTDWLGLIRGLREICFDGQLILDFADTASSFSPLLRPQLLSLAKAAGDYFSWQISIELTLKKYASIVLFGAGNMCRNYMKCFGEKYPPLFTCDNNSLLWGTKFCGLEVKPPAALADLPESCAVIICNIYYREIERQLRDMGIANPVEFFNDEYMPSFYFDRLPQGGRT